MKRVRLQTGSVVFDKRIRRWNFLWREGGHRRSKVIGPIRDYPTKASAWKAARLLRHKVESPIQQDSMNGRQRESTN